MFSIPSPSGIATWDLLAPSWETSEVDLEKTGSSKYRVTKWTPRPKSGNTRSLVFKGHGIQGSLVKPYVVNQGIWRHCYYIAAKGNQLSNFCVTLISQAGCIGNVKSCITERIAYNIYIKVDTRKDNLFDSPPWYCRRRESNNTYLILVFVSPQTRITIVKRRWNHVVSWWRKEVPTANSAGSEPSTEWWWQTTIQTTSSAEVPTPSRTSKRSQGTTWDW